MVMRGNMWSRSAFLVLAALACFPTGVEGGSCSDYWNNVKAENMGACNTCEASCSGTYGCGYGCSYFYGKYSTLASCKTKCDVRPQMNRPNVTLLCGVCVCRKRGVCVCVSGELYHHVRF